MLKKIIQESWCVIVSDWLFLSINCRSTAQRQDLPVTLHPYTHPLPLYTIYSFIDRDVSRDWADVLPCVHVYVCVLVGACENEWERETQGRMECLTERRWNVCLHLLLKKTPANKDSRTSTWPQLPSTFLQPSTQLFLSNEHRFIYIRVVNCEN